MTDNSRAALILLSISIVICLGLYDLSQDYENTKATVIGKPAAIFVGILHLIAVLVLYINGRREEKEDALIDAKKDIFKNQCVALVPELKEKKGYFGLWSSHNHIDLQREECYDTNYIWDGCNKLIVIENVYAVSGPRISEKVVPEDLIEQLSPKGLKHFAESLERMNTTPSGV
jgi:hypothetical protein